MFTLTEKLIDAGFTHRVIKTNDMVMVLGGSAASRYALINKALKKEELIRICRGVYVLAAKYQRYPLSHFLMANQIVPLSYISFESSLAEHGWIPERTATVQSAITRGRTKKFQSPYALFQYIKVTTEPFYDLRGITLEGVETQRYFMATPLRALADLAYLTSSTEMDLDYLNKSLRIDHEHLMTLKKKDFRYLLPLYRFSHVKTFLKRLQNELGLS